MEYQMLDTKDANQAIMTDTVPLDGAKMEHSVAHFLCAYFGIEVATKNQQRKPTMNRQSK